MPFTLAHPAIAVPLARRGYVLSALSIGSLMPDLGYYLPLLDKSYGHTFAGLFISDLPAGLIFLWLFHCLLKTPLLSLLPVEHQRRLIIPARGFSFGPMRRFLTVIVSLFVGSISHLIWDSFTHEYGWVVRRMAMLSSSIGPIPVYKYLQHGGTILGLALLVYWYINWYRQAPSSSDTIHGFSRKTNLTIVYSITVSVALFSTLYSYITIVNAVASSQFWRYFIVEIIISSISFYSFGLILFCLFWKFYFRKLPLPRD
jgi:hypothetical protein